MAEGARFFISYSRRDAASRKLAAALCYSLPRLGHDVFVDVVGLQAGEIWTQELEKEIDACGVFVILVSAKALSSEHVAEELHRALARHRETSRPRILPIRVQYTDDLDGDWRVLEEFQRLEWQSKSDTPHVIEGIDESVSDLVSNRGDVPLPRPRASRRRLVSWIAAGIAALLFAIFAVLSIAPLRALAQASNDEAARAAFARLRTLRAFVLPRLWLSGSRSPESLAEAYFQRSAGILDRKAAPKLASRLRRDADEGLLLSAKAAFKRGGVLSDAARRYAAEQNYAFLAATLRFTEPSPGNALAAWRGVRNWRIVDGTTVRSCVGDELTRCESTELHLDAVKAAAFLGETRLATVSIDGSAHLWDLGVFANPIASPIREGDTGLSVTADGGDVAFVFDVAPRVLVILADGRRINAPAFLPPVARASFGPCATCLTLLLRDEQILVWDYEQGVRGRLRESCADAVATRKGIIATAMRDGTIRFLDTNGAPAGTPMPLRFESVEQLTISEDGRSAAVVHDDVLSVLRVGHPALQLIPAGRTPAPVAAAWADGVLVTRTPTEVRLWSFEPRSVPDVTPRDAWREWRKRLGVAGAAEELGWNRMERRIESQN